MTNNTWACRRGTAVNEGITGLDAKQAFIHSRGLWQNGTVERLNRTVAGRWGYQQVFTTKPERSPALVPGIEYYNTDRRHRPPRWTSADQWPTAHLVLGDIRRLHISGPTEAAAQIDGGQ